MKTRISAVLIQPASQSDRFQALRRGGTDQRIAGLSCSSAPRPARPQNQPIMPSLELQRLPPPPNSLLQLAGKLLGKQAQIKRLIGGLEIDISHICKTFNKQPSPTY